MQRRWPCPVQRREGPRPAAIEQLNQAVGLLIPELILLGTVCVMLIVGPFLVTEAGAANEGLRRRWATLSLMAIGAALVAWWQTEAGAVGTGPFRADGLAWLTRGLALSLGAVLTVLLSGQIDDAHSAEANSCLLAVLAGVCLTGLANDLIGLFLALELVSIPTYVLLYLPRHGRAMQEATIKYVLLSIFSSAFVLYGMALLYGAAGTTNLAAIAARLDEPTRTAGQGLLTASTALLVAGLSFRLAAVPFHFYAPDVFQGVTSSAAALLSFVPKVVGVVALVRLMPLVGAAADAASHEAASRWLLSGLAVATMFVGNLLALRQKDLHRLLAYSSIAHAGYMLVGLAAGAGGAVDGYMALLFYLGAYGTMTLAAFCLLAGPRPAGQPIRSVDELAGLSQTNPATALFLAITLFSLTGMPPTAGFTGKLNLFFASWSGGTAGGRALAIVMAINAAISAWYYLRLISAAYLEPAPAGRKSTTLAAPAAVGAALSLATIALFLMPQPLWDAAARCVR